MKQKPVTALQIKVLALVTMFIDHLAATVLLGLLNACVYDGSTALLAFTLRHRDTLITVYECMRGIGRLAFPLYCFLLVEGFLHTRSVGRYALRLGLFALVSEIPFDLATNGAVLEFSYNNVFFTLLVGLCLLWAMEKTAAALGQLPAAAKKPLCFCAWAVLVFTAAWLAEDVLHTDYGGWGVAAIAVLYLLRRQPIPGYCAAVLVLALFLADIELYALAALPLILFYGGQPGRTKWKYFFYAFYPAHLLLLALVTMPVT